MQYRENFPKSFWVQRNFVGGVFGDLWTPVKINSKIRMVERHEILGKKGVVQPNGRYVPKKWVFCWVLGNSQFFNLNVWVVSGPLGLQKIGCGASEYVCVVKIVRVSLKQPSLMNFHVGKLKFFDIYFCVAMPESIDMGQLICENLINFWKVHVVSLSMSCQKAVQVIVLLEPSVKTWKNQR